MCAPTISFRRRRFIPSKAQLLSLSLLVLLAVCVPAQTNPDPTFHPTTINEFDRLQFELKVSAPRRQSHPAGVLFVQKVPKEAQEKYQHATQSIRDKKSDEAYQALSQALQIFPNYFKALETLGALQMERGQYIEAFKTIQHALEVNPNAPMSHYMLGSLELAMGLNDQSIQSFQRSAQLNPKFPQFRLLLGVALIRGHRYTEAKEPLEWALHHGGQALFEANYYLAVVYDNLGSPMEAIRALKNFLHRAPKEANVQRAKNLMAEIEEYPRVIKNPEMPGSENQ